MLHVDNESVPKFLEAVQFAAVNQLLDQLLAQLYYLGNYANGEGGLYDKRQGKDTRCVLYRDFADLSFAFNMSCRASPDEPWQPMFHGGLIYQGPGQPANGSMPSLTVSLSSGVGWFVHT